VYHNRLAFQWVDVSEVQPGSYWLRSEVDPDGVILESGEANQPAWSAEPAVIPGYVAQTLTGAIQPGQTARVMLGADRFGGPGPVAYRIVSGPANGTLDAAAGQWRSDPGLTYTPAPGFEGTDTFTYMAHDASSPYPSSPAVATVTIRVGRPAPVVQISGAPEAVVAGTSVQLQASVLNDAPDVTWTVTGGAAITAAGLFTAPAVPQAGDGIVTVAATSARGGRDERRIRISPSPAENPKPIPAVSHVAPLSAPKKGPLGPPQAARIGRRLILTVVSSRAGTVRLTAYAGKRRLGTCVTRTPAKRPFTCRLRLPRGVKATAKIRVVASLRVKGRVVAVSRRRAARVPAAAHRH
jgi:Big-like domain-containing protein/lysyl oxidase